MSVESTRETVLRYLNAQHGDVSMLAGDVVFTTMADGQESRGPGAVQGMLHYLYSVAFSATFTPRVTIFGDANAVMEGDFAGKHTGEFAGIAATGKDVCVPLCVVYDLEENRIKRARVYFEMPVLFRQLGAQPG